MPARLVLADLGVEVIPNLRAALELYQSAAAFYQRRDDTAWRICRIGLGNVHTGLAEAGVTPEANLRRALVAFARARRGLKDDDPYVARGLMNEGVARIALAECGQDARRNYERAANLLAAARSNLPEESLEFAQALINEGTAWNALAELDVDPDARRARRGGADELGVGSGAF